MRGMGEYLLTVTTAAIICSIVKQIVGEKSTTGKITKVVSGIFMTLTLVSPFMDFQISEIGRYMEDFRLDATAIAQTGAETANTAIGNIIKAKTESYILEEAKKMELDISVEVKLCDSDPPAPEQVIITGTASPYKKNLLRQFIVQNLGISREKQQWI